MTVLLQTKQSVIGARQEEVDAYIRSIDPVLYMPLWKRDGTQFPSDDPRRQAMTVTGALWTPQGRWFDGSDDQISIPHNAACQGVNGKLTLSWWMKAEIDTNTPLLMHRGIYNSAGWQVLQAATTRRISFFTFQSGANQVSRADPGPVLFRWTHVAIVLNVPTCTIYYDGVDKTTTKGTHIAPSPLTTPTLISSTTAGYSLQGTLADELIFNRALSVLEVTTLYNLTKWRYGL
ncbi:MAG: LamG domain-containing protein [Chloroflexi bacterium]|nr:LamG domain-containing protein [Chloroflexota bacterium]